MDAGQGKTNLQEVAQRVAQRYGCTVLISGEVDIISNGKQTATIHNGTPLFPKVTASGCLLSAVCAAFLAVDEVIIFLRQSKPVPLTPLQGRLRLKT